MPFSSSSFLEDFLESRECLVGGLESNSDSQVSKKTNQDAHWFQPAQKVI